MEVGFLNPSQVLNQLKLSRNMTAVDFGSGSGGWVIPLAKKLDIGKVYAIDILEEPLSALISKSRQEKITNIRTIRSNVEKKKGSTLYDASVDLVLMTNLLFQANDKKEVFLEAKRILRDGGKILVVDWKEDSPLGPEQDRISKEAVKKIAEEAGLKVEKEFKAGKSHYGLVFSK